jgi:Arc/MetJ family transcription regulator
MRTTINLDDTLLDEARRYTGISNRTELIHEALRRMIAREAARRLAAMGGTQPHLKAIPRRRAR